MDFRQDYSLLSLSVFENTLNRDLIRSFHVHKLKDGSLRQVEREFLFCVRGPYVEMATNPFLRFPSSRVLEMREGQVIGLWHCIFAFHAHNHSSSSPIFPPLLSIQGNSKLKSIPSLLNDLQSIFELSCRAAEDQAPSRFGSNEIYGGSRDDCHRSNRSQPVLDQDLSYLPYSVAMFERSDGKQIKDNGPGDVGKQKKRAATEDIARIALEDVARYFDLPIVEASRNLKIGLTALKRKCRELGIPRWPHRKIKSLDSLIHNLQGEAERQKQENEDVVMAVAKRRRMLEWEKETIERKPSTEIRSETKKFRQDVFKRRHKARAIGNQGSFDLRQPPPSRNNSDH